MKKKVFTVMIAVSMLACFVALWYIFPKTFAKGINPEDVAYFSVFDGQTGTGFQITDPDIVKKIVGNLQNTVLKRGGISIGKMGYGFSIEGVDRNGKTIIPILLINDSSTIRKDPFFYSCDGALCFALLKELEPNLSDEVSLPDTSTMQGKIREIVDGTMIVEPLEGSLEFSSSDRFAIPMEHMQSSPEPQVGNIVEIVYDGTIQETDPAMLGAVYHVSVVAENMSSDCKAFNPEGLQIGIDNVTYVCTGVEAVIEPDESAVEHVEIPLGGNAEITAFARIQEGSERCLVCLIGEEWYKFAAE